MEVFKEVYIDNQSVLVIVESQKNKKSLFPEVDEKKLLFSIK
jgi:hypothetical protein